MHDLKISLGVTIFLMEIPRTVAANVNQIQIQSFAQVPKALGHLFE